MPEGVTALPAYFFNNGNNFVSISLPESLVVIGEYAFSGCSSLREVWVDAAAEKLGNHVFSNCPQLTIHGKAGSYIEGYASANAIPFSTQPLRAFLTSTLGGFIHDENGLGIANVSVMILDREENKVRGYSNTDQDGAWAFEDAQAGANYRLSFYHPLYIFNIETLDVVGGEIEDMEPIIGTPVD